MTPLGRRLAATIAGAGPMPVSDFMATCLFDPLHGYYTTREPFGAEGDFTTAPEVSQMFGELVAVWCFGAWTALGRPQPFVLAEIGPGRGTLMADMLRTLARLGGGLLEAAQVRMVEASPRLAERQRATLAGAPATPVWVAGPQNLPDLPVVVVANELFDALPVRQFVRTPRGWRERVVALDDDGELVLAAGLAGIDAALLPPGAHGQPAGTVFEVAPAREAMMETLARQIAARGGAGLFVDYGYEGPAFGDTLQAVRAHAPAAILDAPGEADLTSHVDFAALAAVARSLGLASRLAGQGDFLLAMGLLERAGRLGAAAGEATRERLRGEVERLAGPGQMGDLFKVLTVAPPGIATPP